MPVLPIMQPPSKSRADRLMDHLYVHMYNPLMHRAEVIWNFSMHSLIQFKNVFPHGSTVYYVYIYIQTLEFISS